MNMASATSWLGRIHRGRAVNPDGRVLKLTSMSRPRLGGYTSGAWFLDRNGDFGFDPGSEIQGWGSAGDAPTPGDWNGDGKQDVGVYSHGVWFVDLDGDGLLRPGDGGPGMGPAGLDSRAREMAVTDAIARPFRAMMAAMLRRFFLFPLAVLLVGGLLPQLSAASEAEVVGRERAWAHAVVAQDFDRLEAIYGDGLIYAHSTGAIETKAEYMAKLRQGAARYDGIDLEKTTVRLHGKAAVAHSIVIMRGENAAGPFNNKLMLMHVWVQDGADWKLAAHQTTLLEDLGN